KFRASLVRERVSISSVFPAVAGDFVGATDPTRCQHHSFGPENFETPSLAFVSERSYDAVAVLEQRKNGVLHVDINSLMNTMVLQCANHFQTRAIAHVRKSRIFVAAEMSLQNSAVFCAIKNGAPGFELAHSIGRFLRVQFSHAPLIDVLTAAHGIGEVHL